MNTKTLFLAAVIFVLVTLSCSVEATEPGLVRRVADLPTVVRERLLANIGSDGIADAGQPFNATDYIEHKAPMRRLLFATLAPKLVLVAYEHGGYAYHQHVVAFEIDENGKITKIRNVVASNIKTVEDMKRALRDNTEDSREF